MRALVLAAALSACVPAHRLAVPGERTPLACIAADLVMMAVGGMIAAEAYSSPVQSNEGIAIGLSLFGAAWLPQWFEATRAK